MELPSGAECETCGAARNPGLVACSYCETAYPGAPTGVNCPACGDDNRPHLVKCASCAASLMQSCVFCGGASSLALPTCHQCGEAFEGAHERKAQRDEAQRQQQMMGLATTGISMLGQVASSPSAQNLLGQVWNEIMSPGEKKR